FFYGMGVLIRPGTCFAIALVRIPRPKIEELALQAQGVGIFARRAKFSRFIIPSIALPCSAFFFSLPSHIQKSNYLRLTNLLIFGILIRTPTGVEINRARGFY
ncbi:MAG: hypothetical protein J6Q70_00005, partial [Clostridia bacterium]|nr:hypothetical protein [Clostridia bacterium]